MATVVVRGQSTSVDRRGATMLWAKASTAAFKSGLYFATRQRTINLPPEALAHPDRAWSGEQMRRISARAWFDREPDTTVLTEMTRSAGSYGQTLTLLHLPAAERVWRDSEDEDDGWEPGRRKGPPPIRNLDRSK